MKTVIYWFSGSGNSLHVAKKIAEALDDAELVPVARAVNEEIQLPDIMGLVFPVYAWGPPEVVGRFIQRLPQGKPDYSFAVITCGSAPGSTMSITRRLLRNRGIELDADFTVKMVENYPPMGGAPGEDEQKRKLDDSRQEIERIAGMIAREARGIHGKANFLFSLIGRIVYPMFRKNAWKQAKSFNVDEKCTSCGICSKICPVGCIQADENGRPVWGEGCQQCYACFHWCPEKAIQYKSKTREQIRYHHPEVSLKEMLFRD